MTRCSLAILTVLTVSAATHPAAFAQTPPPDPATVKAEREASTRAFVLCQVKSVKRLDDRKSDPAAVARRLMSACSKEFDENVKVHTRYLERGSVGQQKVASTLRKSSSDGAMQIVLHNRQSH
jgi:hypothetical protein